MTWNPVAQTTFKCANQKWHGICSHIRFVGLESGLVVGGGLIDERERVQLAVERKQ